VSDWDQVTQFDFRSDAISGDIGSWTIPPNVERLYLQNTSLSGNMNYWRFPNTLQYFGLFLTQLTGDASGFNITTNMTDFYAHFSGVDYDFSGGSFTGIVSDVSILFYDCSLNQSQVDNVLVDCDTSGATNGTLNVGGNNTAPSATGLTAKTNLVGKSWTVTVTAP
jgi:hypothetical protein